VKWEKCRCWWLLMLKGTVHRDFLHSNFSQMVFSKVSYSVLIDSPLIIAESRYSYSSLRRVATLRIFLAGSYYLLELSAWTLACRWIRGVDTSRIVHYRESLLLASFIVGSHCWQRRVIFNNKKRTSPSFKETMKQKFYYPFRVLLTKNILKE
jgi:hypothetical protein